MTGITANIANLVSQTVIGRLSAGNGGAEAIPLSTLAAYILSRLSDTSTTSLTIGLGLQSLIVSPNKSFSAGQFIVISYATNTADFMAGSVVSYNATTGQLVVNVTQDAGSGTYASWLINVGGPQGATGATGPASSQPVCGQLQYSSGTALNFVAKNGITVQVQGVLYAPTLPLAIANTNVEVGGVAAQNLADSTVYDVFLKNNGSGTLIPSFYANSGSGGHMADTTAGNLGIEVRASSGVPDSTRSYIGKCVTNASAQFQSSSTYQGVISWYNRRDLPLFLNTVQINGISSTGLVEVSSSNRISFLSFGDEAIEIMSAGMLLSSGGALQSEVQLYLNGTGGTGSGNQNGNASGASIYIPYSTPPLCQLVTEGTNYASLFALVSANSMNVYMNYAGRIRG